MTLAFPCPLCPRQVRSGKESEARLSAQLLSERSELVGKLQEMSNSCSTSHHRSTALQVVQESLQVRAKHVYYHLNAGAQLRTVRMPKCLARVRQLLTTAAQMGTFYQQQSPLYQSLLRQHLCPGFACSFRGVRPRLLCTHSSCKTATNICLSEAAGQTACRFHAKDPTLISSLQCANFWCVCHLFQPCEPPLATECPLV